MWYMQRCGGNIPKACQKHISMIYILYILYILDILYILSHKIWSMPIIVVAKRSAKWNLKVHAYDYSWNPPTSTARRVRVLLPFSYLISHISYSHSDNLLSHTHTSQSLTLVSCILYLVVGGGSSRGADCRIHNQIGLNRALRSYAILYLLTYWLTIPFFGNLYKHFKICSYIQKTTQNPINALKNTS